MPLETGVLVLNVSIDSVDKNKDLVKAVQGTQSKKTAVLKLFRNQKELVTAVNLK